jgi:hypothetical protein
VKKQIWILVFVLCVAAIGISQHEPRWEILVSAASLEQQDGLFFTGPVKGQFLNALAVTAPIGQNKYLRIFARRIDWKSTSEGSYTGESSGQKGFSVGAGYEYRWLPGSRLDIGTGIDLSFQKSEFTGKFFSDIEPFMKEIDHTKYVYGAVPFLSFNYHINKWLMVRLETGASIGIAHVIDNTSSQVAPISPVDVYFDATLRPVSILGLAVRI